MPTRCLVGGIQPEQHRREILTKMVVQLTGDPLPFTLLRGHDAVEQFAPLIEGSAQIFG
jgi:hypothetical protein